MLFSLADNALKRKTGDYHAKYAGWLVTLFMVMGFTMFAQDEVQVGGTLTQDEVWTKDHIYIVYKDLRIPDSVTLTIMDSVTVKIDQGRGIFVLGGNLLVHGQKNDSVWFRANYTRDEKDWKWKGISYTGSAGAGMNVFTYVHVLDAEIAIDIYNSEEIEIRNSCFINSQVIGVRFFNSRNCLVDSCLFMGNYDGIEMVATDGEEASGNRIQHSYFSNTNHNLYLLKAFGGMLVNNLIEYNQIEGGNNGIWLDNGGGEAFGRNTIQKNIFVHNGAGAGYSLMMGQDSIDVNFNIFWGNHLALYYEQGVKGSVVSLNSFYQNEACARLAEGATENHWENNTLSSNKDALLTINETQGTVFTQNNVFTLPGQENMMINKTPDNLEITDNFWNTNSDSIIQLLIWDKNDDPELGELYYNPTLTEADTTNPIAPPMHVVRQLVDGDVRVSWTANPETDLGSYNLYYGAFNRYAFPYMEDAGKDTAFFLYNVSINDTVAVTALDNSTASTEAQLSGHESPFAFSVIYPYAGPDGEICQMHAEFPLNESTVPFAYEELEWSTNGDGTFNNIHLVQPAYYPGAEDRTNGQVILTLSVLDGREWKKDSLTLFIYDDPVVFAGNDTILFNDEQLTLEKSYALYYKSVQWTTTGDGTFDNDTAMHPTYSPGNNDITTGETDLVLMAESDCGSSYDTLHLFLQPFFLLEGKVWHNGVPVKNGVVLAVKDSPEGARAVDLAYAQTDGYFVFDRLAGGHYYLYAVPDTLSSGGAVPGYYADKLRWQQAWYFTIDANTYDVDIQLPSVDYRLPEGEGSVSGYFTMPATHLFTQGIFCSSWFDGGSAAHFCDNGLSNITVFLYNSDGTKLLDYTLTDENGNFYFKALPYGGYLIDAEKAGCETTVSSLITLSPDHPDETGVEIKLTGDKKIGIHRTEAPPQQGVPKIYPNPAGDFLHIDLSVMTKPPVGVRLYNALGQQVLYLNFSTDPDKEQPIVTLNISHLSPGIYFGRFEGDHAASGFTFIKK